MYGCACLILIFESIISADAFGTSIKYTRLLRDFLGKGSPKDSFTIFFS